MALPVGSPGPPAAAPFPASEFGRHPAPFPPSSLRVPPLPPSQRGVPAPVGTFSPQRGGRLPGAAGAPGPHPQLLSPAGHCPFNRLPLPGALRLGSKFLPVIRSRGEEEEEEFVNVHFFPGVVFSTLAIKVKLSLLAPKPACSPRLGHASHFSAPNPIERRRCPSRPEATGTDHAEGCGGGRTVSLPRTPNPQPNFGPRGKKQTGRKLGVG